jgi:hypothetical protein
LFRAAADYQAGTAFELIRATHSSADKASIFFIKLPCGIPVGQETVRLVSVIH